MQRMGPLISIPPVLAEFGVSLERAVQGLDIGVGAFDDADALISFAAAGQLLDRCAQLTDCAHFGLLVGSRHDHDALGIIGRLMANAPTLGDALFDFVAHQHRNSRGAVVYLTRQAENHLVGYAIYNRDAAGSTQIYDLALAVGVNMIRSLTGVRDAHIDVLVCHRGPSTGSKAYEAVLGPAVSFNQPQSALVLAPALMMRPVIGAVPALHRQLLARVHEAVAMGFLDFPAHVRHLLKPSLLLGNASEALIARRIGIHVRTLNRRLREQQTSYRELEQQVRYVIARELLEITDLPVSEISDALSYGNPSAFDRAFQRWSGMSPSAWRVRGLTRQDSADAQLAALAT